MEPKWLEWAKQLQSIAQAGLTYSKDVYDLERFELIRNISVDILAQYTNMDNKNIKELFANETGLTVEKRIIFQLILLVITVAYALILTKTLPKSKV